MSKAKDELRALRQEVRRLQRNTARKIARNTSKGVRLGGSEFDPRVPLERVDRYTRTQLGALVQRLEGFNARGNQYVPGARGVPIPAAEWKRYKDVEARYNKGIELTRQSIGGVTVGSQTMTIGERFEVMIPKTGPSMGGGSSRFHPLSRSSRGVPKRDKIPELIKDLENRMRPEYQSEQEKRLRQNFDKLLKYSDRDDLRKLADKLSGGEFAFIFNFTPAISILAENYHAILAMMEDSDQALELSGIEESYDQVEDMLKWADQTDLNEYLNWYDQSLDTGRRARRKR